MIGSRLALAALAVIALAVAWRVVTFGLAGYFAGDDAALALRFDPEQPDALARLAGERLSDGEPAEAAALTRRAIQARPLNPSAFRALGLAASDQGEQRRAHLMMAAAVDLSRRDPAATAWMFRKALDERDHTHAFRYADALLRRSPQAADRLFGPMIGALDDPAAVAALTERLSYAPPWRGSFLAELTGQGSETAIRAVLGRLQASRRPLTDTEMAWVLRRYLVNHDRGEVRAFWAELLTPADRARLSNVYDGGFETGTGVQPFGWQVTREASASARFTEVGGANGKALHAEHFGARKARMLTQLLVLAPGAWRLSGRAMAEGGGEPGALAWTVSCGTGGELAAVRPAQPGGWRAFDTAFTVPTGCHTQVLALEVRPHGGGAATAWFDDLKIEPLAQGGPS